MPSALVRIILRHMHLSLFQIFCIVAQAIGECNMHKVDDTIASKYRAISESNDGLVFAEFCFHTLLYQAPPQGYVFFNKFSFFFFPISFLQ